MKLTTVKQIQHAPVGRHTTNVPNLTLLVQASGARSWVFRFSKDKKSHDVGMGSFPAVTFAEAGKKAFEMKSRLQRGESLFPAPVSESMTFEQAFDAFFAIKSPSLTNGKHKAQWVSTIKTYAYPVIQNVRALDVSTDQVIEILKPIWLSKNDTATKLRGRIEMILAYAATVENASGTSYANPARYRGHLENILPRSSAADTHLPCLRYTEAPLFMASLKKRFGVEARAFEFLILTGVRKSMVLGCSSTEVDFSNKVWTIPANRNKIKKSFSVPLSEQAIRLLDPDRVGLQFPSSRGADVELADPMRAVLRRMGRKDITPHGFRSTFRDWAGETTSFEREVIEKALGHQIKNKAEAAYARGDLIDKRRVLMQSWADYLDSKL